MECAVIDALANCSATELSNIVAGHASGKHGWATLDELAYFAAAPVDIRAEMRPALLIRPRAQYRSDMTEPQLREITRKRWRVKSREYKYIFCVHDAIIRGVWAVTNEDRTWLEAEGRLGFHLELAEESIVDRFYGCSVAHLLPPKGAQAPVTLLL